jgi:hypothetical protein
MRRQNLQATKPHEETALQECLRGHAARRVEVPPDGACFFTALAVATKYRQMKQVGARVEYIPPQARDQDARGIRTNIVQYMRNNEATYKPYIEARGAKDDMVSCAVDETFPQYLRRMAEHFCYADGETLSASVHALEVPLAVYGVTHDEIKHTSIVYKNTTDAQASLCTCVSAAVCLAEHPVWHTTLYISHHKCGFRGAGHYNAVVSAEDWETLTTDPTAPQQQKRTTKKTHK